MAGRKAAGDLLSVSPFFIVGDLSRSIDFYTEHLGFEVRYVTPEDDPFFAIVGRDLVQIFLKVVGDGVQATPNPTRHESALWDAFVAVEDPDLLAVELHQRGVSPSPEVKDRDDGLRGFEVSDPDGYVLFFGRPGDRDEQRERD